MKNNLNLTLVGKPLDRIDGPLKVTGKARYSAEFPMKKIAYAVPVGSEIANGRIRNIDTSTAEKAPGVLMVLTHKNRPTLAFPKKLSGGGEKDDDRVPLQDANIRYAGQYIALVVAESLECAQHAASLIKVTYIENDPLIDFKHKSAERYEAESWFGEKICKTRGVPAAALSEALVKVDCVYRTPTQNHNPMETHATTASWDGSKLTVYDATQGLYNTRKSICDIFELPAKDVRVVCKFIGGAFGCKGSMWAHVPLCVMATQLLERPVKLVLSRSQMFTNVGHRAETEQRVAVGAEKDGTIKSIIHEGTSQTSIAGEFIEAFTKATPMLYQSPNVFVAQKLVRLNKGLPTFMRAPGETPGVFALECALDELAFALDMDPIALRMKNYARKDQESGMPFSSKSLDKCYLLGSEKIGWEDRKQKPGSRREGDYLIGLGMASATYPVIHFNASCSVVLNGDGSFLFESSTHEMGTGTCTVMAQIGSEELGVPYDKVKFELGDTDLPMAPVSGGSATVSTVGSAVIGAARALQQDIINQLCDKPGSPFSAVAAGDVKFVEGKITAGLNDVSLTYAEALKALNLPSLSAKFDTSFDKRKNKYSMHSFGAQFIEVKVDPDLGTVIVSKAVGVFGNGRIINEKTCRSQVHGGIVMGIGMALQESTIMDKRSGRIVNAHLGEYHVPVNADIPAIEGYFVPEEDNIINTVGAKGIGEIGITGVAAAVANAIFNATGKRVRDLPITPDKIFV